MKIKNLGFVFMLFGCLPIYNGYSEYHECPSGKYHLTTTCRDCPPGCYCQQSKNYGLDPYGNGKKDIYQADVAAWCSSGAECAWSDGPGQCGASDSATIFRCPSSFPYSNGGQTEKTECYKKGDNGEKIFYGSEVECKAGEYLPKGADACKSCSEGGLEPNKYCPKGTYYVSGTKDQGIQECPSGKVHSEDFKECVSDFYCEAGEYLPKGSNKCEPCQNLKIKEFKENQYCPGGYLEFNSRQNQGFEDCPAGKKPTGARDECKYCPGDNEYLKDGECEQCTGENMVLNKDRTDCIKLTCPSGQVPYEGKCTNEDEIPQKTVKCEPSYYIKAKKEVCDTQCAGLTKYCPGGEYPVPSSTDRGIYNCPANGNRNTAGDACTIKLTADQMMYGPMGKATEKARQCWQYHNNISNYVKCLFGKEVQKSTNSKTSQGGGRIIPIYDGTKTYTYPKLYDVNPGEALSDNAVKGSSSNNNKSGGSYDSLKDAVKEQTFGKGGFKNPDSIFK